MTYRVKIVGPSTRNSVFNADIFEIAGPSSVQEVDGILVIQTLPYPGRPAEAPTPGGRPGRAARRATRGSHVCYPRGGWDKVTITDYIEEDS